MKNWCTSRELAEELGVEHRIMRSVVESLRGKSTSVFFHCNNVKRITRQGIIYEYVLDFPLDIFLPLVKEEMARGDYYVTGGQVTERNETPNQRIG